MSQGTNTTKGVDSKREEKDVVGKKVMRDGGGRGSDAVIIGMAGTIELAKFGNTQRGGSGIRCRKSAATSRRVGSNNIDSQIRLRRVRRASARRREIGRIKRKADISRTTTSVARRREEVWGFQINAKAIMSKASKWGEFSANGVEGFGDLGMKSWLQGFREVLAMEEMLTEGIKRPRAEGTIRVLKDRREGREKEVLLEKNGDGGVVEPRGLVGSRKTGEGDGRMRLGDGRGMVDEQTVSSR